MAIIFWISFSAIVYTWLGYPVMLKLLTFIKKREREKENEVLLQVSVVIAAYNEEKVIARRIENLFAQNYPKEMMKIIVASDGSVDMTNEIVRTLSQRYNGIELQAHEQRRGKTYVQNIAVRGIEGDILIFSDAESVFEPDFVRLIVKRFSKPSVGCVIGSIDYRNKEGSSIGEAAGLYWRYEKWIRKAESDIGILAFGTGAALAVRRDLYEAVRGWEDADRIVPLRVRARGYRVEYEPLAVVYDYIEADEKSAHRTRVRKTRRAFKDIVNSLVEINPIREPLLVLSVLSHKTSRHLTPFYMILILVSNAFLAWGGCVYFLFFSMQVVFYVFALIGRNLERRRIRLKAFSFPYNFVLLNVSRLIGVIKAVSGQRVESW